MSTIDKPKYPNVTVRLIGEDGNVFAVIGRVSLALEAKRIPWAEIKAFKDEAFSAKDYDEVLRIVMGWVNVE